MQHLNRLWQLANAASTVRDLTQQTKTYHFGASEPLTFYLRTEHADVQVIRWGRPLIEVTTRFQGAFGWQLVTDQDEAGVYFAARRRNVVGSVAGGVFDVRLPHSTYVLLKLERCNLTINGVSGEMHLPTADDDGVITLT
jgi:hypothetical protein